MVTTSIYLKTEEVLSKLKGVELFWEHEKAVEFVDNHETEDGWYARVITPGH